MKVLRIAVAAAALVTVGILAHLYVAAQTYYPVIRLASPDGLVFTAVQDETRERRACGEANKRFIAPIRDHCPQCKLVYARCERELTDNMELALMSNRPLSEPVVLSPGLRLAIDGPAPMTKQICDFLAADLVSRGYRSAVCIDPLRKTAGAK